MLNLNSLFAYDVACRLGKDYHSRQPNAPYSHNSLTTLSLLRYRPMRAFTTSLLEQLFLFAISASRRAQSPSRVIFVGTLASNGRIGAWYPAFKSSFSAFISVKMLVSTNIRIFSLSCSPNRDKMLIYRDKWNGTLARKVVTEQPFVAIWLCGFARIVADVRIGYVILWRICVSS